MHKKQQKHSSNIYSSSKNDLDNYHRKVTKSNMITIIIGVIVLVLIIAVGVWKYSQSNNNHALTAPRTQKSSTLSSNVDKTIPQRLCGTYTYSLSSNKYYHVDMLWHLTSKHVYQQLVVIRNRMTTNNNNSLKTAKLKWKNNKKRNKFIKNKHMLQRQMKNATNPVQKKKLTHKLNNIDKMQSNAKKSKYINHITPVVKMPKKKVKNNVHKTNIPSDVIAQMSHISHLAENYNEAYNIKKVHVGNNVMNLTLSMNTKVVSKINSQLAKYIDVKQLSALAPHIGNNTLKLQNDNIIYKNKTFGHVPQYLAKKIIDKNDFTQYWAGY